MAKLSPRFVTYFIFALLALAFIFPLTHSAYEGLANKDEENSDVEDEDEDVMEGVESQNPLLGKGKGGDFMDMLPPTARAAFAKAKGLTSGSKANPEARAGGIKKLNNKKASK